MAHAFNPSIGEQFSRELLVNQGSKVRPCLKKNKNQTNQETTPILHTYTYPGWWFPDYSIFTTTVLNVILYKIVSSFDTDNAIFVLKFIAILHKSYDAMTSPFYRY